MSQLVTYRKLSPNYWKIISWLDSLLNINTSNLSYLNHVLITETCKYLEISTKINIWSKTGVEIEEVSEPDEWALFILKALKATAYINPIGGMSFFNQKNSSRLCLGVS